MLCESRKAIIKRRKRTNNIISQKMPQRLPTVLAQTKAGNTSENLLNEIRQIIYSFYWVKGITEKLYNDIMNSIKL